MRVAIVAGEASGDLLASLLLRGLKERWPDLQAFGIGGPRMQAAGFQAWWPSDKLAVRGYVEVLRHYRGIAAIRRRLAQRLIDEPPDVFIGVDAPDFNLGLERTLREAGVRTVHFVCPSIWAWRGGRARTLARSADLVLCLFPFEPALLARHGVPAAYVGHPLADAIPSEPPRAQARAALGLGDAATVLAVLPGSRRSEIAYIAPVLLEAAARLVTLHPGVQPVLPVAPGLRPLLEPLVARHAPAGLRLVDGCSHEVLAACDVALVASGTATLEAALFKRPMVIAYRMHPLSWALMKRMAYQPWVGLPNILCEEFVVPELIQEACTAQALAREAAAWLNDPARVARLVSRFRDLHSTLRQDTARRATDALAQAIGA
ncbi:MAG: lipid-A-disaccharide synthase LpxB [Pseudomonadota bacterium]|jgi:lipid-A-disaccharide synthase